VEGNAREPAPGERWQQIQTRQAAADLLPVRYYYCSFRDSTFQPASASLPASSKRHIDSSCRPAAASIYIQEDLLATPASLTARPVYLSIFFRERLLIFSHREAAGFQSLQAGTTSQAEKRLSQAAGLAASNPPYGELSVRLSGFKPQASATRHRWR